MVLVGIDINEIFGCIKIVRHILPVCTKSQIGTSYRFVMPITKLTNNALASQTKVLSRGGGGGGALTLLLWYRSSPLVDSARL